MQVDGISEETNVLQLHSMDVQGHPSSHMHHMDSSLIVFFKLEDLKMGNTMQVYFPKRDPSRSPHLLSKETADSIPFSLEEAPSLLKRFSFTRYSPQAKAMEDTLRQFPEEILAPKMVACHTMPYSYAVFYCHYQKSKSRVFKVSLVGENGDKVEAIGVCHLDTSQWSPSHPAFQVLKIEPGTSPVCHFFPADNFVWIPSPANTQ
ncbi:hypothetical protein AG4045_001387 [Apium graveolens]|uniref:BURP domain-containing protein n=1 Tax=Apium graveolens TaxID=4045 RepID=A0A6L5B774_APIGR|nr:hypothetical protein AG4045_001387 [Apium graveolens]